MENADAGVALPQPRAALDKRGWLVAGACAVLFGLILRTAWVAEDAYITLRCVDNLVHGYGLRWNVDERVQAYTHPLWMFALSSFYFVTRESYFTTLALGMLTTALALALLCKLAKSPGHALAALLLIGSSRSFLDFSTSGLENPLTHVLMVLFVGLYATRGAGLRSLAFIAALFALNRMDTLLIVAPALVHASILEYRARGLRATCVAACVGLSPWLAWELFSLFYYGFLFPNTAYAKLNTGLPAAELMRQGVTYLLNTVAWDLPLTIAVVLGAGVALASRRVPQALIVAGITLYCIYVVRIGGDFMIGRFFTAPLMAAVCLVAISDVPLEDPLQLLLFMLPFSWLMWHPSALDKMPVGDFHRAGIADERGAFRTFTSLMLYTRDGELPTHEWVTAGQADRRTQQRVVVTPNVGLRSFMGGPHVHYIDSLALTDPLLARLPAHGKWRVGHYARTIPDGYVETIASAGPCQITDANLCEYYAKLHEIIAGDLWSGTRLATILWMNLGRYDRLIDRERYK